MYLYSPGDVVVEVGQLEEAVVVSCSRSLIQTGDPEVSSQLTEEILRMRMTMSLSSPTLPDISPLVAVIRAEYSTVISRVGVPGESWGPAGVGNILYRVVPVLASMTRGEPLVG